MKTVSGPWQALRRRLSRSRLGRRWVLGAGLRSLGVVLSCETMQRPVVMFPRLGKLPNGSIHPSG